ncbi:ATP-binding protein [Campylobacter sp. RM16188]|uniref:AAA family ATPase n=1 Tax=Campylobacter sp. RM16188 TaxID=1705725 RepID=UPI001556CB47|nr:ATP-binding protein [Campylobacter sp. RM16188]
MKNPFPFETLADGSTFYGRQNELDKIYKFAKNSSNLLIYSKRRMGKTTLIKEFMRRHQEEFVCIYSDIFDMTCGEDFVKELLKNVAKSQKANFQSTFKFILAKLKRISFEITLDPLTYELSASPMIKNASFDEAMDDLFNMLDEISKEKKVVFIIDEFQQIAEFSELRIDAKLRKFMQTSKNISFIFLGSKRHILTLLFSHKMPLFEMATHFELGALKQNEIYKYAKNFLKTTQAQINELAGICKFDTKLIQNVLYFIYENEKIIDKKAVLSALDTVLQSKDGAYRLVFDTFTGNQKKALEIIVKGQKEYFSLGVLSQFNISKTSLQAALKQLFAKEIIDKQDGEFFIPDTTFGFWLERVFMRR